VKSGDNNQKRAKPTSPGEGERARGPKFLHIYQWGEKRIKSDWIPTGII